MEKILVIFNIFLFIIGKTIVVCVELLSMYMTISLYLNVLYLSGIMGQISFVAWDINHVGRTYHHCVLLS